MAMTKDWTGHPILLADWRRPMHVGYAVHWPRVTWLPNWLGISAILLDNTTESVSTSWCSFSMRVHKQVCTYGVVTVTHVERFANGDFSMMVLYIFASKSLKSIQFLHCVCVYVCIKQYPPSTRGVILSRCAQEKGGSQSPRPQKAKMVLSRF